MKNDIINTKKLYHLYGLIPKHLKQLNFI